MKRRVSMAMTCMGQLRHLFNTQISFKLKMKVYKSSVCSLLTYGCEVWDLNDKIKVMLNGANARFLSRFTGKDAHAEASVRTRSFDLVLTIGKRRFKWLGHILRMSDQRLVKLTTGVQHCQGLQGNMFIYIPGQHSFIRSLCKLAKNRKVWREMSCRLDDEARMLRYVRVYTFQSPHPQIYPHDRAAEPAEISCSPERQRRPSTIHPRQ